MEMRMIFVLREAKRCTGIVCCGKLVVGCAFLIHAKTLLVVG